MIYSDIEDLIFCPDACRYVRDGVRYTAPFFTRVGGIAADAFLFYDINGDEAFAYGGVAIDSKEQRVVKVISDVDISLSAMLDDKDNEEEYASLYERIHDFVFEDEISEDIREYARRYLSFIKRNDYKYILNVYTELFPEVMEWLEKSSNDV